MLLTISLWILLLSAPVMYHQFTEKKHTKLTHAHAGSLESTLFQLSLTLTQTGILDNNWFTKGNLECVGFSQHLLGNCVNVKNIDAHSESRKKLFQLTPCHILCYVIVRRLTEIVAVYSARWILIVFCFMFVISGLDLLLKFASQPPARKFKVQGKTYRLIRKFRNFKDLSLIAFLCSSFVFLNIFIPPLLCNFGVESLLLYQTESLLRTDSINTYDLLPILKGRTKTSINVLSLYHFPGLRQALFDLERSGIVPYIPGSFSDKLCLQTQIVIINLSAVFTVLVLYAFTAALVILVVIFPLKKIWKFTLKFGKGAETDKTKMKRHLITASMQGEQVTEESSFPANQCIKREDFIDSKEKNMPKASRKSSKLSKKQHMKNLKNFS